MGGAGASAWGWSRSFVRVLAPVALAWAGLAVGVATPASAEECSNARFRTGPSANLPDCRAYELVTPANKGDAADLFAFERDVDAAVAAPGGERIAVHLIYAKLEPNPGSGGGELNGEPPGSSYVFSRGRSGWQMTSVYPEGSGQTGYLPELFNPDLTEIGVAAITSNTASKPGARQSFGVGVPGGPYMPIAKTPTPEMQGEQLREGLDGASADLSHVVLRSADRALAFAESERIVAGGTVGGALDLYEWVEGKLRLVNLTTGGALVSSCGAVLGDGTSPNGTAAHRAVSENGSKIFFTAPEQGPNASCPEPARLYTRVDGSKTVEVSEPAPGVHPAEQLPVVYDGASADGSKVFFNTKMKLTKDDQGENPKSSNVYNLYEYDTEAPEGERLERISRGEEGTALGAAEGEVIEEKGEGQYLVISEDGSTVYFLARGKLTPNAPLNPGVPSLYRYDTNDGSIRYIANVAGTPNLGENMYTTPDGEFLLFPSDDVVGESRGAGHEELYRYNNADGSLMCVSCGSSNAPKEGTTTTPTLVNGELQTVC